MKNIAYFCRTPIQVFRTIQLQIQINVEKKADCFIFDSFAGSKKIYENIKKSQIFNNIYYIADKDTFAEGYFRTIRTIYKKSCFYNIISDALYDEIYFFNIYSMANDVVINIQKRKNNSLVVNMVEDGPSIYHIEHIVTKTQKYIYPMLQLINPIDVIDFWWFSKPEVMEVFGSGKKKQLPQIDKSDKEIIRIINYIFDYKKLDELESAEIIFMEECYWNDGLLKGGEDYVLFKQIKQKFENENICLKLHPRTRENRFGNLFKVLPTNGIPWEVYALNMNMNNKILVSLSCATMISSKLLYGDETYSLLLYPLIIDKIIDKISGQKYLTSDRVVKINEQKKFYSNKSKFFVANDLNSAIEVLDNWLEEIRRQNVNTKK